MKKNKRTSEVFFLLVVVFAHMLWLRGCKVLSSASIKPDAQGPCEKVRHEDEGYNLSSGKADRRISGSHWPGSPANSRPPGSVRDPASKRRRKRGSEAEKQLRKTLKAA